MKIFKLKKLNKAILVRVGIVVFALLLIFFGYININDHEIKSQIKISENNPSWNTYTNETYGFSIDFPADWEVYENYTDVSPTINIYLPIKNLKPPFDQFSEVNNVSIFPKGLETEAVIGQSRDSKIELKFKSDIATDYLLKDGQVWATYINFDDVRDPWKSWGFLWSKVIISDIEYQCLNKKGYQIDLDTCDPFGDDQFVRIGSVDPEIRKIEEEIIKSFKFMEQD